jgi:hypothetical protein
VQIGFAIGWALIAVLSSRFTDQPQRWAVAPAIFMVLSGALLLLAADVDVGPYRLHLECTGSQGPTVILEPGGGGSAASMGLTHPRCPEINDVVVSVWTGEPLKGP